MPYSRTRRSLFLGLLLFTVACLLFSACGGTQSQGAQQKVKLKFVSWIGGDQLPIYQGVIKRFEAAHPNIAVDYEVLPFDQLGTQLKARFNADTAPDVMALFAGGFKDQFVDANDLLDLSNESWVPQIADNAKTASLSKDGKKTVVMPISGSAVGVVYNKKLLQDHNVAVPKTWSEFLQACATLKTAGITPITIGSKDVWPIGWMPDAMSLQTIYRENPNYGTDIIANKVKYATTPAWNQVFEDIKTLNTSSYIDKNNLGTDYQSSMDLLATGKAAMSITIQSSVGTAKKTNPDVSLGMFPLPYGKDATITVPTLVDVTLGVSSKGKHTAEARQFLNFFAQNESASKYLSDVSAFPTFKGITPTLDPALQELLPAMQASAKDLSVLNFQGTVNDTIQKGIQSMFSGQKSPQQVTQDMDKANVVTTK